MSKKVIIGSRESRLAVIQSEMVRDYNEEKILEYMIRELGEKEP